MSAGQSKALIHPFHHISQRNQVSSPLLRLPGELRNEIFEKLLGGQIWTMKSARPHHFADLQDALRVSQVCRQIYNDDPIYTAYAKSSFAICNERAFVVWVKGRAIRHRQAITSLIWICPGTAFFKPRTHWEIYPGGHELCDFSMPPFQLLPGLKRLELFGRLRLSQPGQLILGFDYNLEAEIRGWIDDLLSCVHGQTLDLKVTCRHRVLVAGDKRDWYELI
ncbi:hypothetical protein EJ07DRAFT_177247 [Lizonia empirigonia]|nr:hypothetical protein EJ07DRAFT_177247 [Lizonia empirigonia]